MNAPEREVVDLLADLVAIDSVNPDLDADGAGEAAIARFVHEWARRHGLRAETHDTGDGRPSVVVRGGRGDHDARRLLLCAHLDTVGVGGMADPLVPRIDGDRLHGRGSYDMKAGLAASLIACRTAERDGLAGEVIVAAVADEENASRGVRAVLPTLRADAAVVTEPTEMAVGVAHKGFVWIEIEVTGVAAHGSRPQLGVDAVVACGPVLVAVRRLGRELAARQHPLLGGPVLHAGVISGGRETSTIPDRCVLTLERRGEAPPDEPIVDTLVGAVERTRPGPATVTGMSYWADSALIAAHGIPTVLFGPGGAGAHADVEWVSIADTVDCARILSDAARTFCVAPAPSTPPNRSIPPRSPSPPTSSV